MAVTEYRPAVADFPSHAEMLRRIQALEVALLRLEERVAGIQEINNLWDGS